MLTGGSGVAEALADHNLEWESAEPVTEEMVALMVQTALDKKEKEEESRRNKRERSTSVTRSTSQSLSRSLSSELQTVAE